MINRRDFLTGAAGLGASALLGVEQTSRPNIVLIMADDMGFSDIGPYGSEIRTPNLDKLAQGGLRFSHFYNGARCCPTRASLLTGLYAHQAGVGHMVDNPKPFPGYAGDLNRQCVTIAEALRPDGYQTMMAGKWHVTPVTQSKHNWPVQRGFDRYYGIIHGAADYFNPVTLMRDNSPADLGDPKYYLTDAIASNAVDYIRKARREQPFFLYTAFTSPHWPLHALEPDIAHYRGRYKGGWDELRQERHRRMVASGMIDRRWHLTSRDTQVLVWRDVPDQAWQQQRMETYAAQIDRMDQGLGRILNTLRETGREDNTLVLFLSDNGGCAEELCPRSKGRHIPKQTRSGEAVRIGNIPGVVPGTEDTYQSYGMPWANASNTPFRLYKHWVHEGGISTPLIAHWPRGMQAEGGSICHDAGHIIDIMTTCLDVAQAKYPTEFRGQPIKPAAGVSLRPAFEGKRLHRGAPLFWEHEGNRAVHDDRWKLVARHAADWELYDLEADRTETNNLGAQQASRVERMTKEYQRWASHSDVEPWDKVVAAPSTNPASAAGA